MPWTLAHPAVVLPLRRLCPRYLSFIGLLVGAMTPDLPYHVERFDLGSIAHRPMGWLLLCLPLGLLIVVLLRRLHQPIAVLLPQPHRGRLQSIDVPRLQSARDWLVLALSVLMGAATHAAWDAFTHADGYVVLRLPARQASVPALGGVAVYKLLQHGSTLLGLVCLCLYYLHFIAGSSWRPSSDDWKGYRQLAVLALVAVGIAALFCVARSAVRGVPLRPSVLLVLTVIHSTTLFFGLLVLAALWRARHDRNGKPPAPPLVRD